MQVPALLCPPQASPARSSSPSFPGGSLLRRLSHSRRLSRASHLSLDSLTDQPDVTGEDTQWPQLPCTHQQMAAYFHAIGGQKKAKIVSQLQDWLEDRGTEVQCGDTGSTPLHVAAQEGETKVLSSLLVLGAEVSSESGGGETALHLAVSRGSLAMVKCLVEAGADTEAANTTLGLTPLQCSVLKSSEDCSKYLLKHGAEHRVVSSRQQSLLHLACLGVLIRLANIREKVNKVDEPSPEWMCEDSPENPAFRLLEERLQCEEGLLYSTSFTALKLLLKYFDCNPINTTTGQRIIDIEDDLPTSPGLVLHYFCAINYVEGVEVLLQEPFLCDPNCKNKNGFTPIIIAAKENNFEIISLLLEANADPNCQDLLTRMTPLHLVLSKYHIQRRQQTCEAITALMSSGADPSLVNAGGESPAHIVVQTQDIQLMACFLDFLSSENMNMKDSAGDSLLHYVASCMDEDAIFKVMSKGAKIMCRNKTCIYSNEDLGFEEQDEGGSLSNAGFPMTKQEFEGSLDRQDLLHRGERNIRPPILRGVSQEVSRIPLQDAMKNGNAQNYFNALARVDLKALVQSMERKELEDFQRTHIIAATREVRADIVRTLFQYMKGEDPVYLHRVLVWSDKGGSDNTFYKTALEWAVENNDRLCTTEILHQEYKCHQASKEAGLNCLRNQLTGDELLVWTIETFNMFYPKTWYGVRILPFFYTMPLIMSYFSFIFDNYSDIELSYSYYRASMWNNLTELVVSSTNNSAVPSFCPLYVERRAGVGCDTPVARDQSDYFTAFVFNVFCIVVPLTVFAVMFAIDTYPILTNIIRSFQRKASSCSIMVITLSVFLHITWLICSTIFSPLYLLYVATKQVFYKYKHISAKKKNKYRGHLAKFEYLWGIARTAESGFESCGQLLLQIWLLSFDLLELTKESKLGIANQTINGLLHFATFSWKPADETEKSLAKVLMSINSVVMCVAASYRTLKRGAVTFKETIFVYLSLFCQVLARILSFLMLYLYQRNFFPTVPVILVFHFLFVGIFKWFFERARHSKNGLHISIVTFINIFASSIVYVRIVPIEKPSAGAAGHLHGQQTEHTTFLNQSLFFLLVLIENVLLGLVPLVLHDGSQCCVSWSQMAAVFTGILLLCLLSWVFHTLYYKYYGHPWSDINGPDISSSSMRVRYHLSGEERECTLRWRLPRLCQDHQERRGLCWIQGGPQAVEESEAIVKEAEVGEDDLYMGAVTAPQKYGTVPSRNGEQETETLTIVTISTDQKEPGDLV